MNNLIVLFMICLYTCQSLACSQFPKAYPGDKDRSSRVFSTLYGLIVFLVTIVIALFRVDISLATLLFGIANGTVLAIYNQMLIKSSSLGPYSIVMIFMLGGAILLPLFWSVLIDKLPLPVWDWIAIFIMLLSFLLLNKLDKTKMAGGISGKFILSCVILGSANGFYGILLDEQQQATNAAENPGMIIVTFTTASILSLLLLAIPHPGKLKNDFRLNGKSVLWALASSIAAAIAVNMQMYVLAKMDSPVLFTLNNGGVLVLSVLISLIFLGEKLTLLKGIGIALALASILILSF